MPRLGSAAPEASFTPKSLKVRVHMRLAPHRPLPDVALVEALRRVEGPGLARVARPVQGDLVADGRRARQQLLPHPPRLRLVRVKILGHTELGLRRVLADEVRGQVDREAVDDPAL